MSKPSPTSVSDPHISPYVITGCLLAVRSALFLTSLPEWLRDNPQLSSPLTSYQSLNEGVYLLQHGFDPYQGGPVRHSPLMLAVFSTLLPLTPFVSAAFWSACDGVSALCLIQLLRRRRHRTDVRQEILIAMIYIFHPYTALPTLALSTSSIDNMLHILTLYHVMSGNVSLALFTLAALTCTSLPSILLAPPIIVLAVRGPNGSLFTPSVPLLDRRKVYKYSAQFITYLATLVSMSSVISAGFRWISRTWGAVLTLPDLTPNPGLWWYFFTEIFDHFRPFFLMVFSVHLLIYVAPVTFKLQHDPLFATFILQGIIAMLKSYPTLSDPGLFTAMHTLFPELVPELHHPLPTVMLHVHAAALLPMFHHLWMGEGTGNANFFYASTLVFGLANAAGIVDTLRAGLRLGFRKREGWDLIQS